MCKLKSLAQHLEFEYHGNGGFMVMRNDSILIGQEKRDLENYSLLF
jgi:hypothetical protein